VKDTDFNKLNKLPSIYLESLSNYIVEETNQHILMEIPIGLIDFDRKIILENFKDCTLTWERNQPNTFVKLFKW
jgi:hypothetical protein